MRRSRRTCACGFSYAMVPAGKEFAMGEMKRLDYEDRNTKKPKGVPSTRRAIGQCRINQCLIYYEKDLVELQGGGVACVECFKYGPKG